MSEVDLLAPEQTADEVRESLDVTQNGQTANTIRNCKTVFQHDLLLKGAVRYNLLTEHIDIVRDLGWRRSTSVITDTDMKYLLLYFEETYGITSEKRLRRRLRLPLMRTATTRSGSGWTALYGTDSPVSVPACTIS